MGSEKSPSVSYTPIADDEETLTGASSPMRKLFDSDDSLDLPLISTSTESRRWTIFHQRAMPLTVLLLAVVVAAQSALLLAHRWVTVDIAKPWPVPDFQTHTQVFTENRSREYGAEADKFWNEIMPISGLIAIKNPEQYGLLPGVKTELPDAQVYATQVTHEYHCLKMIREIVISLTLDDDPSLRKETDFLKQKTRPPPPNRTKLKHVFHCFDYLRQAVMCRADTTIEWQSEVTDKIIDGYGPPHQCRNWDEVVGWMISAVPPESKYHDLD